MSAKETPPTGRTTPLKRTLHDVKVHVVPCSDCIRLLWVDRKTGIMQGVFLSQGAVEEAMRALASWGLHWEPLWRRNAD